ncbi:hypothetical protein [uncultured Clostridium sp.]|uniref:hypothetical protein n=3 Tax=Clostridium TaxID=1485 RepID=UPI0025FF3091|nr:hypothetical protein [uncultured Clostridium sp.]MDU4323863.1 hypothetical protein [Clostridium celatum]
MGKSYRDLNSYDKYRIVDYYYKNKDISMDNIAINLNISDRAVRRVLKEEGINTRLKNRYILDENYFDCIDTESKAYILGFIYADGFVGDEKFNNIVIAVNDLEILEFIAKEFKFTGNIRKTKKGGFENSKCGYSLNFSSKIMASRLREIGLYPNKSLTIDTLPQIDKKLVRHFIRGYFDGDGSIVLSHNTSYYKAIDGVIKYIYPTYCFMILGTKGFLEEIIKEAEFNYAKIHNTKSEKIKCIKINAKKEFNNIFKYLYDNSTIKLQRKYNKWNEIKSAFAVGAVKQIG